MPLCGVSSVATELGTGHLALYPGPVEGDPAVDSVLALLATPVAVADVSNEDMLAVALVCQGTTRVSLTGVLIESSSSTQLAISHGAHGSLAGGLSDHGYLHLQEDRGGGSARGRRPPSVHQSVLPVEGCGVGGLSEAGGSVDVEVDLLLQLEDGDVVTEVPGGRLVVLVVDDTLNLDILHYGGVRGGGEVVISQSDLAHNV